MTFPLQLIKYRIICWLWKQNMFSKSSKNIYGYNKTRFQIVWYEWSSSCTQRISELIAHYPPSHHAVTVRVKLSTDFRIQTLWASRNIQYFSVSWLLYSLIFNFTDSFHWNSIFLTTRTASNSSTSSTKWEKKDEAKSAGSRMTIFFDIFS